MSSQKRSRSLSHLLVSFLWYLFGRMLLIKWAIKRHFTMPPLIAYASALPGKTGNTKIAFFTRHISAFARIQPVVPWCIQFFESRVTTHIHAAIWLPKYCNQCLELSGGGAWFRRKEVESTAAVGLCCTHKAPLPCLLCFCFLFLKVVLITEALDRWGWKTKHHLIFYFLSNTCQKYRNGIVYVKIIASKWWKAFLRHSVIIKS